MGAAEGYGCDLDEQVRHLLEAGDAPRAITLALRQLGPEVFGFIAGVLGRDANADEVFAITSERLWRSLPTFAWRCPLRAWAYIIARNEIARFRSNERRHAIRRVPISELEDVIAAITTQAHTQRSVARRERLATFRDELPVDDRALLILRVDRQLSWDDIALAFVDEPATCSDDERKREAARLRKRFQLVKERLAKRARAEGLL
ncbi:MAG: sigma-70 family RNA polymerase sigma factor [Polyangiaceae bacterium]|jgi:RNA polymerase sigma-70 factor (ECF subfamily)|nr:sigma-70 family RNA polymerase sigma factor [Polyangiaceae bacterium]